MRAREVAKKGRRDMGNKQSGTVEASTEHAEASVSETRPAKAGGGEEDREAEAAREMIDAAISKWDLENRYDIVELFVRFGDEDQLERITSVSEKFMDIDEALGICSEEIYSVEGFELERLRAMFEFAAGVGEDFVRSVEELREEEGEEDEEPEEDEDR